MPKRADREQQLTPDPSTSPSPAAPCAGAGAARSSRAAFCRLKSCPRGKAQQQGQKHPVSYVLHYGERRQHVHARNSNYLPLHRNITFLTKSLYSIQSIRYASVFSDHLTAAQHPALSDQVAAAGLRRSTTPPCKGKPLIKRQRGARAHGPSPPLCHARGARRK